MEECNCGNNTVQFSTSCGHMASECKEDLDVDCSGSHATCEGKYNQAKNGIIGLTMEFEKIEGEAYCGPTGRCAGEVKAAVKVHKPAAGVRLSCALEPRQGHTLVLEQSRSFRKPEEEDDRKIEKAFAKAGKMKSEDEKDEKEKSKVVKKEKASKKAKEEEEEESEIGNQEHFGITGLSAHEKGLLTCSAKVESDEASCKMEMPPRLKPEGDIEGLCRLVEDATNEIITKDAWFVIKNAYNAPKAEAKPKMAEAPAKGGSPLTCSVISMATVISMAAAML